jgi:hypothetical protein
MRMSVFKWSRSSHRGEATTSESRSNMDRMFRSKQCEVSATLEVKSSGFCAFSGVTKFMVVPVRKWTPSRRTIGHTYGRASTPATA